MGALDVLFLDRPVRIAKEWYGLVMEELLESGKNDVRYVRKVLAAAFVETIDAFDPSEHFRVVAPENKPDDVTAEFLAISPVGVAVLRALEDGDYADRFGR